MTTTNEMLSNSDIRYNYLIGSILDVIGELDLDGTISFVSPKVYDLLGYHPDEMIGTNFIKFIHPDDVPGIRKAMKKGIKSKEVMLPNLRLKHKKGNYILVFAKGKLIELNDKARLIGIIRDITKFNETEKKLEESQNIFEQINDVLLKFKEDSIFNLQLLINTAGLLLKADCALFNVLKRVNGKEVLESTVIYNEPPDFIRESDPKGHICTDIIKDNPDDVVILRNLDKTDYIKTDKNVRKYNLKQCVGYVVRFNNKPTAIFCVVYAENREMSKNDISILKILSISASTELARWNSRNDLQESEEKYKSLFEQCPIAILLINLEGIIEDCNTSTEVLFGYTKKELLGIDYLKFDSIPLDTKLTLAKSYSKFLKTGVPENSEIQMYRKDGKMIWINSYPIVIKIAGSSYILAMIQDITERKKSEDQIHYQAKLIENVSDAIISTDLDFNILSWNKAAENIYSWSAEEVIGKNIRDTTRVEYPYDEEKTVLETFFRKGFWQGEVIQLKKDNSKIQVYSSVKLIKDSIENPIGSVAINRDITEWKRKEEELRLHSEIIENMSEGVYLIKLDDGTIVYTNPAFEEMFDYNPGEMIGKDVAIVNAPTDKTPEEIRNEIVGILKDTGEWHGEVLNIKKDGTPFWCYANVSLFDHPEYGRVIISVHTDITERKIAEQKLIKSEAKHRGLLETAVMGLIEIDLLLNKISYINPKLLEIVGYTREELKDNSIFYKLIHPEDLEELLKSNGDRDVEFRIYSKEGKLKWLSGTRKYTISENSELINVRLWLQDITESKEIEEIKSSLLTRFSHEFKTPLISIKGFADFLLTEYKVNLDEKILSFLRRIKEGSNRLEVLINSFMETSQLEKAVIRVNLRQEDVSDLIQEVLHELEGFIGMRKHIINVSLDEKLITNIDKEKIYTVISNILINAINYTPQGGKISIKSSIDKNFLTISMKDNGIGLTEEEKNRLFKPFGKIERYGKGWDITAGGMGMGLYISKEIIKLHGGKIWAESEGRSKGSEFCFSLPIK